MSEHPEYPIRHGVPAMDRCKCGGVRHWHAMPPYGCDDCDCAEFVLDEDWREPDRSDTELQALVDEQADDEMLWFQVTTVPEAYLQQELRRLHAAIENWRAPEREPAREEVTLDWHFYPDNGQWWTVRKPWSIHVERDANSYGDGTKRIAPAKLEGSIYMGCESTAGAKQLAQRLQNVLDGAPVESVLIDVKMPLKWVEMWAKDEPWNNPNLGVYCQSEDVVIYRCRDALLAKFGAVAQVRECPTGHVAPNGQKWDDFEWFICEGGEDYEKWTATDDGIIYAFCPDCGAPLDDPKGDK